MMRKHLCSLVLLLTSLMCLASGDPDYSIANIPQALLKNANVVYRIDDTRVEVENLGKMRVIMKYAVTILNEAGERYAQFGDFYDKLSSIKNIDGKLYDASGKKIRELKKSE